MRYGVVSMFGITIRHYLNCGVEMKTIADC